VSQATNGVISATKYGQFPRMTVNPPKQVADALGVYADFWRKGMTVNSHGYGIGALVYFRRIVEGITDSLLERLAVAMDAGGDPAEEVKRVRDVIGSKATFDVKVKQAATMMPPHLRPGVANPLDTIFRVVSSGLHGETDDECCDLVNAGAAAMVVLIARLNTHVEELRSYGDAVRKIQEIKNKRKPLL
jgi:hypothetical protein